MKKSEKTKLEAEIIIKLNEVLELMTTSDRFNFKLSTEMTKVDDSGIFKELKESKTTVIISFITKY